MVAVLERRSLLDALARYAIADVVSFWRLVSDESSTDFQDLMIDGVPELLMPYMFGAGELSAQWYNEAAPALAYQALNFAGSGAQVSASVFRGTAEFALETLPPQLSPLQKSVKWALGAAGEKGLDRLGGVVIRQVLGGARETTVRNAKAEGGGALWARYASGNACKFCQMLATRSDVYVSEKLATHSSGSRGNQAAGTRYHDNCKCLAVEVRPGGKYEPPDYVSRWEDEYKRARAAADDGSTAAILRAWEKL